MVSGLALADLAETRERVQPLHSPFEEAPMVHCSCCQRHIEPAEAFHSRYRGQAVCRSRKQAEKKCGERKREIGGVAQLQTFDRQPVPDRAPSDDEELQP